MVHKQSPIDIHIDGKKHHRKTFGFSREDIATMTTAVTNNARSNRRRVQQKIIALGRCQYRPDQRRLPKHINSIACYDQRHQRFHTTG